MSIISIPHRVIEVAYTPQEQIFVAHRVVEVAWRKRPTLLVSAHVIEVAHTRAGGRVYTVGHI